MRNRILQSEKCVVILNEQIAKIDDDKRKIDADKRKMALLEKENKS